MMSLLDTVKSLLGLEDTSTQPRKREDVAVTVEHEPSDDAAPATESEDAVKGTQTSEAAAETTIDSEPATDAANDTEPATDATNDSEPAAGSADEPSATEPGESLDVIKGIGPAYADRLSNAGIETVDHLAEADAADLSEMTAISEKRLSRWIERAKHR